MTLKEMLNRRATLNVKIGVAVNKDDAARIDALAKAAGVGRGTIVRTAALRALPELEAAAEKD